MDASLSAQILTVGNSFNPPKGGMAQVVASYRKYIFKEFKCIVNYKPGSIFARILSLLSGVIRFIYTLLFDKQIKIVHIHSGSGTSFRRSIIFARIACLFHKKVILHMHGGGFKSYYYKNKRYVDRAMRKVDYVIALTESWKRFFISIGCKNVKVVNNIIDEPKVNPLRNKDKIHFLFLGLICDAKGIFDLLEVCNKYHSTLSEKIELHVAGNGEVSRLINYITENQLSDFVKYEGWVSGKRKEALLNSSDVYILPSYAEGLPISILEALSYGLYIIATDVGGIPEIVNSSNGEIIIPNNLEQLYQSILNVVNNIGEIRSLSNTRMNCSKPYMPDAVQDELVYIYNSILKSDN